MMEDLKAVDARGIGINKWDKVFYSDSKHIELKVGVVFAILRNNEVLIEKEDKGEYLQRDGGSVGIAYRETEEQSVFTENDLEQWLIDNYPVEGMTQKDIAEKFGVSKSKVSYYVYVKHSLGATKYKSGSKVKKKEGTNLNLKMKDWLDENYVSTSLSDSEIMELDLFRGVSEKAFKKYLQR